MTTATLTTSNLDGLVVYTVRFRNLTAHGTAKAGERPASWTVVPRRGRWTLRGSSASVKASSLLRGRELAAALKAVETGRL